MAKKAIITVKTNSQNKDDSIEVVSVGQFHVLKNGYKAEYDETEISGMEGTRTVIFITDKFVKVIRSGKTENKMKFEKGQQSSSLYKTPYGILSVVINTKDININIDENGGKISIFYYLNVEGEQAIETNLDIIIKAK